MSLYGDYIKEREDKDIIESDKGFATFKIFDTGECYVQDIYVRPEHRQSHVASEMVDQISEIAKEHKCKILTTSVWLEDKNVTRNMQVCISYGFHIYKNVGSLIYLKKDLNGDK